MCLDQEGREGSLRFSLVLFFFSFFFFLVFWNRFLDPEWCLEG